MSFASPMQAEAMTVPICAASGRPYPVLHAAERLSPDRIRVGGSIAVEVAASGEGPLRVWVSFIGPQGPRGEENRIAATGTVGDGPATVVATGSDGLGSDVGTYDLYAITLDDAAGCRSFYYGSYWRADIGTVSYDPRMDGFDDQPHGFDFSAEAFDIAMPVPGSLWGYVAGAETLDEIRAAVDYRSADAGTLRLYRAFLNRDPDVAGSKYWISTARGGANPDDLSWGFARSAEFQARYGELSNEDFLAVLYQNMLGRAGEPIGVAYWLDEMANGLSQSGVVRWIVANDEFIDRYPFGALAPTNPGDTKDCADFSRQLDAQAWYDHHVEAYGDVAKLIPQPDGRVCVHLP